MKFTNNLLNLPKLIIAGNEQCFDFADGNNTALQDLSITGQDDAVFRQRHVYQVFIVAPVEKRSIVTDKPQPFSEFTGVQIDDKTGNIFGTHVFSRLC
jgi:hypothetical protein